MVIWITLVVSACLGAHIGPEESNHMKSLDNESRLEMENINLYPARFKISLPKHPKSFKDYLHDILARKGSNESLLNKLSDGEWHNGKVVVVERLHKDTKTNREEWTVVDDPRNNDLNDELKENQSQIKGIGFSLDDLLDNEDIQKYVENYESILFSFKDLVKMSTNPSMREKIDKETSTGQITEKLNVTYIMPIPTKNNKYFKIVVPNLTEPQYQEINTLLQEHIIYKYNKTEVGIKTTTMFYPGERENKKHLSSRSLTDSSLFYADLEKPKSKASLPSSNLTDAIVHFEREPTEYGYRPLLLKKSSTDLPKNIINQTESKEPEVTYVVRNNGISIPIATDYKQNSLQDNMTSNAKLEHSQRSITSQRSQRPQTNKFNSITNRLIMRNSTPTVHENIKTLNEVVATKKNTSTTSENTSNLNEPVLTSSDMHTESPELYQWTKNIPPMLNISEKNFTRLQMSNTNKVSEELSELSKDHGSMNILQAANFILDMKKKINEEERKKNERYKSYIKSYLGGDNSIFPTKSVNGSVMKINKHGENILEELKLLMLEYFTFLNFNLFDSVGTDSLAIESILNATDLFELMERSSKLVKINLQYKLQNESREPTGFVKKIVERQVEKCKEITNNMRRKVNQSKEPITIKTHKTYMVFTRCMNLKLTKCLRGFSFWLQRGKFFRRPKFSLSRAYQNYEIEKNLYCLRTHKTLTSESIARGIRVNPGLKLNRKFGMRRKIKGGARDLHTKRKMSERNNIEQQFALHKVKNRTRANGKTNEGTPILTRQGKVYK